MNLSTLKTLEKAHAHATIGAGPWWRYGGSLLVCAGILAGPGLHGATFGQDFAQDPATQGWLVFGDTNLFHWNASAQNLGVTWDSSRPNSFFYFPLGTILDRDDDFSAALDLQLQDVTGGVNPTKPSTFELALGFFNLVNSTATNFFRGNSQRSPNLVEFDYFPDTGFGSTIWPSFWSTNSVLNYNGSDDYILMNLPMSVWMRLSMTYTASDHTLVLAIRTNGIPIASPHNVSLSAAFTDFRAGAFGIESYSDAGQDPRYGGSLLAHGLVDNILLTIPPGPVQQLSLNLVEGRSQVTFLSRTNWRYTLERSADTGGWNSITNTIGTGVPLVLEDSDPPTRSAFYRVRAERP